MFEDAAHSTTISQPLPPALNLFIETLPIADLAPLSRKLKAHKKRDIAALAAAIQQFGFLVPILVDRDGKVVSGHARVDAARLLRMEAAPCIRITHLDKDALRAFAIAENQLGVLAGWDAEALKVELQELSQIDLGFSLELTGFSAAKIDSIILSGRSARDESDLAPGIPDHPVSRVGDLWLLGEHKLLCGDSTDRSNIEVLLAGEQVRAVVTDPPYNVAVSGHISKSTQHGEFVMASGEMSDDEFTQFLSSVLNRICESLMDGGLCYFCMDWRHMSHTLRAAASAKLEMLNLIVWDKIAPGMGSFYRSQHELIFLFRKSGAVHLNRVELGIHGRNRSNVWTYEGMNGFGAGKAQARDMHPTVKPTALVRDAILDCSARREIVLDLFSGSGTTLIAAEQSQRLARAVDLDPHYVDVGVLRWQNFTGLEARLAATGQTFREVQTARQQRIASDAERSNPSPTPTQRVGR